MTFPDRCRPPASNRKVAPTTHFSPASLITLSLMEWLTFPPQSPNSVRQSSFLLFLPVFLQLIHILHNVIPYGWLCSLDLLQSNHRSPSVSQTSVIGCSGISSDFFYPAFSSMSILFLPLSCASTVTRGINPTLSLSLFALTFHLCIRVVPRSLFSFFWVAQIFAWMLISCLHVCDPFFYTLPAETLCCFR